MLNNINLKYEMIKTHAVKLSLVQRVERENVAGTHPHEQSRKIHRAVFTGRSTLFDEN